MGFLRSQSRIALRAAGPTSRGAGGSPARACRRAACTTGILSGCPWPSGTWYCRLAPGQQKCPDDTEKARLVPSTKMVLHQSPKLLEIAHAMNRRAEAVEVGHKLGEIAAGAGQPAQRHRRPVQAEFALDQLPQDPPALRVRR